MMKMDVYLHLNRTFSLSERKRDCPYSKVENGRMHQYYKNLP